ncbi:hypothetical protein Dsin_012201 [Dipteronia sinensis]|uniref:Myb/SANT-like domain-containing protein n=1 Tax=Dipteronia sinensis TaxID=43782 RepID=A0AAE0AHM3_9ROSI|nr:hypothetical protein Dsin_012201 [Dipteronia sinensis]
MFVPFRLAFDPTDIAEGTDNPAKQRCGVRVVLLGDSPTLNGELPNLKYRVFGLGNRQYEHFDKEITGRDYDKKAIENKWDSLKTNWKLWSSLLHKETGIEWDPAKEMVDAPPELWQSKIEMSVEYRKFRDVGISPDMMDMYDKMFKCRTTVGNCVMIPSSTILLEETVGDSEHDQ